MRSICNYFDGGVCCHPQHGGGIGEVSEDYCEKCPYYRGEKDADDREV